jgi:hypothetical protein
MLACANRIVSRRGKNDYQSVWDVHVLFGIANRRAA